MSNKNTRNGKHTTIYGYHLVSDNGVVMQDIPTRKLARNYKRNLIDRLNLKNRDISIIQTTESFVR